MSSLPHSMLTELLVAGYSVLGDVYKMLMLKIRPQKYHYHTFIDDGKIPAILWTEILLQTGSSSSRIPGGNQ